MSSQIIIEHTGRLGRITLNRPEVINAITMEMVEAMLGQLDAWRSDPAVEIIVLDGAGERGFCAGGDIRFVREHAVSDPAAVHRLWWREYQLDLMLASYPKPVVAFADGITMGGGIGLAGHVSHRVVTTRSRLAMPETLIGLAPDVGGLHLLSRAPRGLGTHLALTGASVDGPGALRAGLADILVSPDALPEILSGLQSDSPDAVLAGVAEATTAPEEAWLERCYRFDTIEEIRAALAGDPDARAQAALAQLDQAAPLSVAVTLTALRRAESLTLAECLAQDYQLSCRFLARPDLSEGIRAKIVDKDNQPRWQPDDPAAVTAAEVAEFFAPISPDWSATQWPPGQ